MFDNNNKDRNQYSLYNAVSALGLTLTNGFLTIIVTRFILSKFGSDFNGINATANQIVNVLLIIEGGFTLASNVALFIPVTQCNYKIVNGILAATKMKFRKIAIVFFSIGFIISLVYSFIAKSELQNELIATVILMAIIPTAINLFYAATYRVLLQAQQKEYIINIISLFTISSGHVINIFLININCAMWVVRFVTMICALINSFLIGTYVKRNNNFINLKVKPLYDDIKGTNDVMAQKITGVIYDSAPIVFLSVSLLGGTKLASVYAVYSSVFIMLKSLMHGLIDAPRHSLGQILATRKKNDVWAVFSEYELLSFIAIFILVVTGKVLILPFIKIYTVGIDDFVYYDPIIAFLMVLIASFELIHIPSGHLMNMAGKFKASKNIQIFSCTVLIVGMLVGGTWKGIYGMLAAILLVAILLAVLEIGYVHTLFFEKKLLQLAKLLLPFIFFGIIISAIECELPIAVDNFIDFFGYGILLTIFNTLVAFAIAFCFCQDETKCLFERAKLIISRYKR
jgi:hypothetical protein